SDTQQSPFWAYIRLLMAQFDGLVQGQGLSGGLLQGQSQGQGQGQGQGFRRLLAQPLHRTTSLASLPQHGLGSGLASSAAGAEQPGAAGEAQPEAGEEPLQLLSRVPHLTSAQLYFLCSLGDLGDITAALNRRQAMASQAASRQQGRQQAGGQQHGQQGQQGGQEREQVQGGSDNTQGSGQGQGQEAAGHSNTGSGRGSSSGSSKVGRRRHEPGSGLVTDWDSLSPRELAVELAAPGRCTAFVKSSLAQDSTGERSKRLLAAANAYLKVKRGQPQPSTAAVAREHCVPYATLRRVIKRGGVIAKRERPTALSAVEEEQLRDLVVTPDFSDIFVAQAAWFTYAAMVRIFKHYHFKLHDTSLPGTDLAYSSYPGQLSSDDDFYLVNPTHLAVLQVRS
ncbi:hypothetical protein QJQ45_021201, partial [Haematococcus lacustris]